ncbi:aspartate/glutamate racemase family protein [Dyadobacter sp. CY312]|uniref:aspartate/glutamate racemase family protein n=1 Tax=Dyadobacter sp. CY312 TaxID=2907303 RepID=UPI001F3B057D|nr:aspartate/glutamate racemase family protein [Dyadobacter sp. CY312]MCE7040932.1 aspartate/glutamate racemase family protein [Dyadobacter sp. CY312]
MKKIGLVGGISWTSTIDYYRLINEGVNNQFGGINFAECIIYSVNFNDFVTNNTSGNWDATYQLLYQACISLEKSGAEGILLCANTAHAVADQLQQNIGLPIIHIVDALAAEISRSGLNQIGLLGTKFTMEMDFYKDRLAQSGIKTLVPARSETRDYIQQTLKEELGKGIINPETKQSYLSIITQLVEDGAQGIVLGCTEIPMLISSNDVAGPVFDTTAIHAASAVDFMLANY